MDEKTEELRDIFLSMSEEDTVTETQERGRGSLATEGDVREQLQGVIEGMRAKLGFETDLSDEALVTVVEAYYAGESDTEIARKLDDVDSTVVRRARLDCHIVRERDTDAPFDLDDLRRLVEADRSTAEMAADLDVSESTVRRYRRVLETQQERLRVADRYRGEFESILRDRDLAERLTSSLTETGLEGATEGQEVDVDF